jgi:hypothetical protein
LQGWSGHAFALAVRWSRTGEFSASCFPQILCHAHFAGLAALPHEFMIAAKSRIGESQQGKGEGHGQNLSQQQQA